MHPVFCDTKKPRSLNGCAVLHRYYMIPTGLEPATSTLSR